MKIGLTNVVSCKIGSTQVNRVYIGSTLIWSYSAFDPDAQLFITNAAITEPVQQNAVNNLVLSLKSYGIWTKMKALYPMVGGTAAQHKFNLRNPLDTNAAFRLVFNGGWTHSSTGALPNGTNAWGNTFFYTTNWTTKDNAHLSYYSRTNGANSSIEIGLFNTAPDSTGYNTALTTRYTGDLFYANLATSYSSGPLSVANTDGRGYFMANRNAVNLPKGFKNGVNVSQNTTPAVNGGGTQPHALAAYNDSGGIGSYSIRECAFSSFGDGLTDTEAANYYTAVQTFQTTLGRHVGVPIVSDSDAQAFLNAAVITDTTQATAVNTLVTDLKGYGIWSKIKALYPFVGGTAASHKWNLKNPLDTDAAFRLTFNGGITHSANGVQGNETNGYYKTFINPSVVFSPSTGGSLFYYSRLDINTGTDLGALAFSPTLSRFHFNPRSGFNFVAGCLSFNYVDFLNDTYSSKGFFGTTREPNAPNYYSIINANSYAAPNDAYQEPNAIINGLGLIADNGQALAWSNRQHAMACVADGLTPAEAQNLRLANLTFQTTLSRNV